MSVDLFASKVKKVAPGCAKLGCKRVMEGSQGHLWDPGHCLSWIHARARTGDVLPFISLISLSLPSFLLPFYFSSYQKIRAKIPIPMLRVEFAIKTL